MTDFGFSQIGSGSPLDRAWLAFLSRNARLNIQPNNRQARMIFDAGWHARDAEVDQLKRQLEAERRGHAL